MYDYYGNKGAVSGAYQPISALMGQGSQGVKTNRWDTAMQNYLGQQQQMAPAQTQRLTGIDAIMAKYGVDQGTASQVVSNLNNITGGQNPANMDREALKSALMKNMGSVMDNYYLLK